MLSLVYLRHHAATAEAKFAKSINQAQQDNGGGIKLRAALMRTKVQDCRTLSYHPGESTSCLWLF